MGACSPSEKKALKAVVKTKFTVGDDGLLHNVQCDEEIERIDQRIEQRRNAGKMSAQSRWRGKEGVLDSNDRDNERSTDVVTKSCSKEVKNKELKSKELINNIVTPLSLLKGREEDLAVDVHAPPFIESVGAYIDDVHSSSPDTKVSSNVVSEHSEEDWGGATPVHNVGVEEVQWEESADYNGDINRKRKFKADGNWWCVGNSAPNLRVGDIVSFKYEQGIIGQDVMHLTITSTKQPVQTSN